MTLLEKNNLDQDQVINRRNISFSGAKSVLHDIGNTNIYCGDGATNASSERALHCQDVRVYRLGGLRGSAYAALDLRDGWLRKPYGSGWCLYSTLKQLRTLLYD